jgi:hypothetical protein
VSCRDDPIPEQDLGLDRLRESNTNIVVKGEHVNFDSLRVPQGSGISRESVATVMNSTRWDRYFRKKGTLARTNDPPCRILRVVSRLLGSLDAAPSETAVRPGTTRKVAVRKA